MQNPKVLYKEYNTNQLFLPMDLEEMIPPHHISRLIHHVVEQMEEEPFEKAYPGGGRSPYHPKMMLKIVLYAYTQKITSGRQMARACQENLPMMWLAARQTPDFRTINRFRSERMKGLIDRVFESLVLQLVAQGLTNPEQYFLDGTKVEANANKYSFVWLKATKRYQQALSEKIRGFLEEAVQCAQEESEEQPLTEEMKDLRTLSSAILADLHEKDTQKTSALVASHQAQQLADQLQQMEEAYETKQHPKKTTRMIRKLRKYFQNDALPRLTKYEAHHRIAAGRNSFSKTDPDATFMRMKEDPMRNGQLKAGYNVQIGTNRQFILHYTLHPNPTDTKTLIPHLASLAQTALPPPKRFIADAGYGSEENYLHCEELGLEPLIPYAYFRKEQSKKFKETLKYWQNWTYHAEDDSFTCPFGRTVDFLQYQTKKEGEHTKYLKIYECEDCTDCPYKAECTTSKGNRRIYYNPTFEELKANVRHKLLEDETAKALYAQRKIEPESVFGNLKQNLGCTRFCLRGKEKVHIEFGLYAMAHNVIKWWIQWMKSQGKESMGRFLQKTRWRVLRFSAAFSTFGSAPLSYTWFLIEKTSPLLPD